MPRPDRTEARTSAGLTSRQCPTKKRSAKPPKLTRALKTAAKVAAGRVGAKGMKVFRKSAQYDSVNALLDIEAAAGADDRRLPALLAIQLRLHQLSPRDPGPLVDAAGILANLNKPREALALLNAADKTHRSMAAPLGMNGTAIALNNRGYALLRLGQYRQAKRVLTQAIKKEPLLSEARTNRSAANLCQYPKQLWFNAGITRSPAGPAKNPPVDVNVTVAPPSPGLKPIELPEARSWDQVGSNWDVMDRWLDRLAAEKRTGVPKLADPLLIASGESTRAVYDAFLHTIDEASQDPRLSGDAAEALEKAMEYRFHEMQYGDGSAWKCAWQLNWYYNDFRPASTRTAATCSAGRWTTSA